MLRSGRTEEAIQEFSRTKELEDNYYRVEKKFRAIRLAPRSQLAAASHGLSIARSDEIRRQIFP